MFLTSLFSGRSFGFVFGFLFCSTLFSMLAFSYHYTLITLIDEQIGRYVYQFPSEWKGFFLLLTFIGSGYIQFPLVVILVALLCYRRRFTLSFVFLWNYLGVRMANSLLKEIFERERPHMPHLVDVDSFSFPSGHAMQSIAFFGLIAYHYGEKKYNQSKSLWVLAVLVILLIGVSRIYFGVHYPTDIIAGYMLGTSWLIISIGLYKWAEGKCSS